MRKLFSIFAALTLSVGLWAADHYVPIKLDASTLNGDVVMGKNQSADDVRNAGHAGYGLDEYACFYSNVGPAISDDNDRSHGLPASVNVPNSEGVEVPFNFTWTGTELFDGFDAIHLVSNGEAVTVDFKGGNAFKGLYFLATAGNVEGSSSSITVTITYLDKTSAVSDFDILDWYYDEDIGKPTNAKQGFYRYNWAWADYADNGPCLYCLSLNDALDPLKPIKSLTFTQTNNSMCTAIFAITGILSGCTPQAPQNISGIYEGSTTKITFDEVTKDLDGNDITDVTYVYDVARDPNFIKMLDGYTNQPLTTTTTDGKVTGTINAKLKGFYIRLRAKNTCGVSLNSDVIVDDEAEFFMVTIPESADYSVSDYISDARYLFGETVSFTAQAMVDGMDIAGWKDNHGTSMSTTSQVSFTITKDTTIMPNIKTAEREFTLANGVTGKMGTLNKTYPWLKTTTKPGLAYRSATGHDYQDSRDTLVITPEAGVSYRLKFDYAVSSEEDYDIMSVWVNNEKIASEISGSASGSYDSGEPLLTEPTTIVMSYSKDEGWREGEDRGYIYNIVVVLPEEIYTRDVTNGSWGTICLPWESTKLEGGDFYDVLGTKDPTLGVALVELEASENLTAGKPYVFKATSSQIKVTYNPATEVANPVAGNHIIGSFTGCTVPNGMYIIYNNLLYITNGSSTIGANRAYFDVASMEAYNPATAPARVVFFGGRQAPTSLGGEADRLRDRKVIKVIEDGQFRIVRDGKTYNAQGQRIQ